MNSISVKSYAKINLSIDVLGKLPNGYHQVEMIMQQINLCDNISVKWIESVQSGPKDHRASNNLKVHGVQGDLKMQITKRDAKTQILVKTNRPYLPTDERNIAYKAAKLMLDIYGDDSSKRKGVSKGQIRIDIKKRIPVAAGLAGGSGNAAAVLIAINKLWNLKLSVEELCALGEKLGSDVPFCIMGQMNAADAAFAYGSGTSLKPVKGLDRYIVLSKPPISVSTAQVYSEIDAWQITQRPDNKCLIEALNSGNIKKITENMVNVLEAYTTWAYDKVAYTKDAMLKTENYEKVMMSGTGPTIFGVFREEKSAQKAFELMKKINKETFITHTTCNNTFCS